MSSSLEGASSLLQPAPSRSMEPRLRIVNECLMDFVDIDLDFIKKELVNLTEIGNHGIKEGNCQQDKQNERLVCIFHR
jgi:hypothetical protein